MIRCVSVLVLLIILFAAVAGCGPAAPLTSETKKDLNVEVKKIEVLGNVRASQAVVIQVEKVERDEATGIAKLTFRVWAGEDILQRRDKEHKVSNWYQAPVDSLKWKDTVYVADSSSIGFGESFTEIEKKAGRDRYLVDQIRAMLLDVGVVYATQGDRPVLEMDDAIVGERIHVFPVEIVREGEKFSGYPLGTRVEILNSETRVRKGFNRDPNTVDILVTPPYDAPYQTRVYEGPWFGQQSPEDVIEPILIRDEVYDQLLDLESGDHIYVFVEQ